MNASCPDFAIVALCLKATLAQWMPLLNYISELREFVVWKGRAACKVFSFRNVVHLNLCDFLCLGGQRWFSIWWPWSPGMKRGRGRKNFPMILLIVLSLKYILWSFEKFFICFHFLSDLINFMGPLHGHNLYDKWIALKFAVRVQNPLFMVDLRYFCILSLCK